MPRERETIGSMTSAIRGEDLAADVAALSLRRLLVALKRCHAAGMDVTDITHARSASARCREHDVPCE